MIDRFIQPTCDMASKNDYQLVLATDLTNAPNVRSKVKDFSSNHLTTMLSDSISYLEVTWTSMIPIGDYHLILNDGSWNNVDPYRGKLFDNDETNLWTVSEMVEYWRRHITHDFSDLIRGLSTLKLVMGEEEGDGMIGLEHLDSQWGFRLKIGTHNINYDMGAGIDIFKRSTEEFNDNVSFEDLKTPNYYKIYGYDTNTNMYVVGAEGENHYHQHYAYDSLDSNIITFKGI